MKKFLTLTPVASAFLLLASQMAYAGDIVVPEMDAAGTVVALGLTVAVVALVKERRKK